MRFWMNMRKEGAAANGYCQFIAVGRSTDAAQTGTEQIGKNIYHLLICPSFFVQSIPPDYPRFVNCIVTLCISNSILFFLLAGYCPYLGDPIG